MNPRILGCGHATPQRVVTNAQIESELGLAAGWIERRTGILERRICAPEESCSTLAIDAAQQALAQSGVVPGDVGLLLLATSTPDYPLPPTAPSVARAVGAHAAGALDLAGACAGFVYALSLADAWVRAHRAPAIVVAANVLSRRLDPADPGARAVFADGGGAVVLGPGTDDHGLRSFALGADASLARTIQVEAGGSVRPVDAATHADGAHYLRIHDAGAVFSSAVEGMVRVSRSALNRAQAQVIDIDRWVPHQANARILNRAGAKLNIDADRYVSILPHWGNSSAASIPTALSVAARAGQLEPGHKLLLTAVGAGMVEAAAVVDWTLEGDTP